MPADPAKNHFSLRFFKHYIHTDYKQQKKKKEKINEKNYTKGT